MNRRMLALLIFVTFAHCCRAAEPGSAANGCAAFGWNVEREIAAMREPANAVSASANNQKTAAMIEIGRHYQVTLRPQAEVRFAVPPARPARDPAPHGGSLRFSVATAGRYRIALTSGHWIDVVADGKLIDSIDHRGNKDCALVHKVVEFELPADQPLTLQLSGSAQREIGLAITPAPAAR